MEAGQQLDMENWCLDMIMWTDTESKFTLQVSIYHCAMLITKSGLSSYNAIFFSFHRLRSSLNENSLNALLQVSINGPKLGDASCEEIIATAAKVIHESILTTMWPQIVFLYRILSHEKFVKGSFHEILKYLFFRLGWLTKCVIKPGWLPHHLLPVYPMQQHRQCLWHLQARRLTLWKKTGAMTIQKSSITTKTMLWQHYWVLNLMTRSVILWETMTQELTLNLTQTLSNCNCLLGLESGNLMQRHSTQPFTNP